MGKRRLQRIAQASREAFGGFWVLDLGLEHDEFVAAQAGYRIALAHRIGEPAGHFPQDVVPDGVTEGVVDGFEAVQIQKVHRELAVVALRKGNFLLQTLKE